MTTTYKDLEVVHHYVDEITTFINKIVQDENLAFILATQVFEDHSKRASAKSFLSEEERSRWLDLRARNVAIEYLRHERNKKIKEDAIAAAIHDHP